MLVNLNRIKLVKNSKCILGYIRYISQSTICQQIPAANLSFLEKMDKAIDQRTDNLSTKKDERQKAKKERYDSKLKRRDWETPAIDTEDAKRQRLETTEGERIKRKKSLVLLGYSGVKYSGMQRNPGASTIEEEVMKAMLKNKWITEQDFQIPQHLHFQRAARTDKGVSACRQVISLKLPENIDIEQINKDLPEEIKIFSVKRVTKNFNAKGNCDARTYSYTLPSYAFAKKDEEYDEKSYRLSSERLEELNKLLNLYEGTKNYHNFTIRKDAHDPSAKRYMMKLECKQPFVPENTEVEFSRLFVKGQSFMMHQIRRMVGMVIAIMKGYAEPYIIAHAMHNEKINVPQAPGLGLVLERVHYERYNKKYGSDGMHQALDFKEEDALCEDFYSNSIVSTIIETELKDREMLAWVKGLNHHSFTGEDAETTANNGEEDTGNASD